MKLTAMGVARMEKFCRLCMSESTDRYSLFDDEREDSLVHKIAHCLTIKVMFLAISTCVLNFNVVSFLIKSCVSLF